MVFRIEGGRIIDPSQNLDATGDLWLDGNRVIEPPPEETQPDYTIDARGKWVVPGLIDLHVHLREPGHEYKEDIYSGARAAAAGGFTAVVCMPNTSPPNDSRAVTEMILRRASNSGGARVYPAAAVSVGRKGTTLTEMGDLLEAGAVAFTDDGSPIATAGMARLALEYAATFGALVMDHPEEPTLSAGGQANEGAMATRLGLGGWPSVAEDIAVARDVLLAEYLGARMHIQHVSSAGAVELIRGAKERGAEVSAEVTPHHLLLNDTILDGYPTDAKVNPPIREQFHVDALRQALKDGVIDAIATDHAPHSVLEKEGEFGLAAFGISGLESAVPLCLELVSEKVLTPSQLVAAMSTKPAQILRVKGGTLKAGHRADVTMIDPACEHNIDPTTWVSKGRNTPFAGRTVPGKAVATFVDGKVAHWALPGDPP